MIDLYEISKDIRNILEERRKELNLYFIEDNHKYFMNDLQGVNKSKWPSVSGVLKKFYSPFPTLCKVCNPKEQNEYLLNKDFTYTFACYNNKPREQRVEFVKTLLNKNYLYFGEDRKLSGKQDEMSGSYLGPEYSDKETEIMARRHKAPFKKFENFSELCTNAADLLSQGNVVGWFQGRMEWGPRALGSRSILSNACNPEMKEILNLKVKQLSKYLQVRN